MKVLRIFLWILFTLLVICGLALLVAGESGALVGWLICTVIVAIPLFLLQRKAKQDAPKKQAAPKPGSEYDIYVEMTFKDGLGTLTPGCYCMLGIKGDNLEFKTDSRLSALPAAVMSLTQVCNIGMFTETELIDKSRNVIGRGVAGGIVFGPVGAIVGGLSGTKNKQTKKRHQYLVLNYIPSGATDPVAITFEELVPFSKTSSFVEAVKARVSPSTIQL